MRLDEAIQATIEIVKKKPMAVEHRVSLAQLICFTGDLERADQQLETSQMQDPEALMKISMYRQLIRGEMTRRESFEQGRPPELLQDPTPLVELNMKLLIAFRENDIQQVGQLSQQIEEQRPVYSGTCDGQAFEDMRDMDDRTIFFFEVITSTGKYYWVPFDSIESIEFHPPVEPCDLLWRRATMNAADQDGDVFIPVLYPGSSASESTAVKLGRETLWDGEPPLPAIGFGQRMFWIGDDEKTIMELQSLKFNRTTT